MALCQKYQQELSSKVMWISVYLFKTTFLSKFSDEKIWLFRIVGNPLLCGQSSLNNCSVVFPEPLSFPPNSLIGK